MNPALEEASGASGASPMTTFRRVTVPVLLPGILAPFILVCLVTLEQFELPSIIGIPAKVNIFSYRILYELNPADGLPNYGGAAAVALPFLVLGIVLLAVYNFAVRRAERFVTVTGKAYIQRRLPLGRWRVPALHVRRLLRGDRRPAAGGDPRLGQPARLRAALFLGAQGGLLRRLRPAVLRSDLLARGAQHARRCRRLRAHHQPARRPGRLDALAPQLSRPHAARLLLVHVDRHSLGDRRPRRHAALPDDPDRHLRHGRRS